MATAFFLTPAETRPIESLLAGGVLETTAALGVAMTTAKTHLENIFQKTGVKRQAELMRLAARAGPRPRARAESPAMPRLKRDRGACPPRAKRGRARWAGPGARGSSSSRPGRTSCPSAHKNTRQAGCVHLHIEVGGLVGQAPIASASIGARASLSSNDSNPRSRRLYRKLWASLVVDELAGGNHRRGRAGATRGGGTNGAYRCAINGGG